MHESNISLPLNKEITKFLNSNGAKYSSARIR